MKELTEEEKQSLRLKMAIYKKFNLQDSYEDEPEEDDVDAGNISEGKEKPGRNRQATTG